MGSELRRVAGGMLVLAAGVALSGDRAGAETSPKDSLQAVPSTVPSPCRLPARLPPVPGVHDPVFAVLLGLLEQEACGILTRSRLERAVRETGRTTRIPVDFLHILRRRPRAGDGPAAEVWLVSIHELDLPVPYEIVGYHPGTVRAAETLVFEEWRLGTIRLAGDSGESETVLEDVRVWGLRRGWVQMDVDGWLDRMLGSRLDDMQVGGFAFFRYGGKRMGLALGYGRDGQGRSGAFDFGEDTIVFPAPAPLKRAGAHLRSRLERLMPTLVELRRRAD